jgi:hypothetical protein
MSYYLAARWGVPDAAHCSKLERRLVLARSSPAAVDQSVVRASGPSLLACPTAIDHPHTLRSDAHDACGRPDSLLTTRESAAVRPAE